jgi:hypothetical protein
MRPLQRLTWEAMMDMLSPRFTHIPAARHPARIDYSLHDTLMRGLALMCLQHPSLLELQRQRQQRRRRCHRETLFGGHAGPSDPQRRELLDGVPVELVRQVVPALLAKVRRVGWATALKSPVPSGYPQGDSSRAGLDGRDYVHSTQVQWPGCLQRTDSNGQGPSHHTVVSATLVTAGFRRVRPWDGEDVRNSDGQAKQDWELNAAQRLRSRLRQEPPPLPRMIGGDALDCHAPFSAQWRALPLPHVWVGKPPAHLALYAGVADMER